MISFSEIRNHEFQTQRAIAAGSGGQMKKGDTRIGTSGMWFQPFNGASDIKQSQLAKIGGRISRKPGSRNRNRRLPERRGATPVRARWPSAGAWPDSIR